MKNAIVLLLTVMVLSCNKNQIVDPTEENEVITTIKLNFTEGGIKKTFTYADPDGDGGMAATKFETIALAPNKTYTLSIELLDESKNPVQNLTDEIAKEADEHLLVYTPMPSTLLTYTYGDKDSRNQNVGLTGTIKTGATGTGKLKVQLIHQPPVSGKPIKDGTTAPGSDDVNLDFTVSIQ